MDIVPSSASNRGAYRRTDTCVGCGKAIDVKKAAYTADGMICATCEAGEMLREADVESRANTGMGALAWGILALVCNPFFIPSILAIVGGVRELQTSSLVEPERRASRQLQGIFAIVLGAFWPVLFVGVFGLLVLASVIDGVSRDAYYDDPYYEPYEDDPMLEPYYDDSFDPPVYDDPAYAPVMIDPDLGGYDEGEDDQGYPPVTPP